MVERAGLKRKTSEAGRGRALGKGRGWGPEVTRLGSSRREWAWEEGQGRPEVLLEAEPWPVVLQLLQHHICAAVPGHHCPRLPLCHCLQLPDQGQLGPEGREMGLGDLSLEPWLVRGKGGELSVGRPLGGLEGKRTLGSRGEH